MFDVITNCKILMPRNSLYCVWVRARDGENAPLIRVWIDPAMTTFESPASALEPDATGVPSEIRVTLAEESAS